MPTSKRTVDPLYIEEVLRARKMPADEKLSAGIELFEYACEITRMGIRRQFPEASDEEVNRILDDRLAMRERTE
jgi:Rv0078B-related antitoxin